MDWAQLDCIINKNKMYGYFECETAVLKVLTIGIVYFILSKEETCVDYVVTINTCRIEDNHYGWNYWFSDSTTCRESTM